MGPQFPRSAEEMASPCLMPPACHLFGCVPRRGCRPAGRTSTTSGLGGTARFHRCGPTRLLHHLLPCSPPLLLSTLLPPPPSTPPLLSSPVSCPLVFLSSPPGRPLAPSNGCLTRASRTHVWTHVLPRNSNSGHPLIQNNWAGMLTLSSGVHTGSGTPCKFFLGASSGTQTKHTTPSSCA